MTIIEHRQGFIKRLREKCVPNKKEADAWEEFYYKYWRTEEGNPNEVRN
jgi:hypothetical protein